MIPSSSVKSTAVLPDKESCQPNAAGRDPSDVLPGETGQGGETHRYRDDDLSGQQLAVVPGDHPARLNDVTETLAGRPRHVVAERLGRLPGGVTTRDRSAHDLSNTPPYILHRSRILDRYDFALDLDSFQIRVLIASLDQAANSRIAGQIERLLRAPVGPERDLAVDDRVVHRHQVRHAVRVDRRELHLAAAGEHRSNLVRRHGDAVALLHWR